MSLLFKLSGQKLKLNKINDENVKLIFENIVHNNTINDDPLPFEYGIKDLSQNYFKNNFNLISDEVNRALKTFDSSIENVFVELKKNKNNIENILIIKIKNKNCESIIEKTI